MHFDRAAIPRSDAYKLLVSSVPPVVVLGNYELQDGMQVRLGQ